MGGMTQVTLERGMDRWGHDSSQAITVTVYHVRLLCLITDSQCFLRKVLALPAGTYLVLSRQECVGMFIFITKQFCQLRVYEENTLERYQ